MKALVVFTLLSAATHAAGQQGISAPSLQPGGKVSPAALAEADWLQGSAPEAWEADKVYVLECWATWCGPCVAAIPHVNELHGKFGPRGLRVFGMNVWEDGRDKVAAFVRKQGDKMSYPVAYTGPESRFEKDWLKAAAVRGIPHAFVVKNGRLLFTTHPTQIDAELVAALLEGGEAESAAVQEIRKSAETDRKTSELLSGFRAALRADDHEAMATAITALEVLDPEASFLPKMKLDLAIAAEDWEGAGSIIGELSKGDRATQLLGGLAYRCDSKPESLPRELQSQIAGLLATAVAGDADSPPTLLVILSRLQWALDDKDSALATARQAAEKSGDMPAAPFERYLKSVEEGEPAKANEVFGWLRKEMMSR